MDTQANGAQRPRLAQGSGLRLLYNIAVDPKGTPRHLNRFRSEQDTLRKPTVDYVPPILAVTINDQCNLRCPNCLYVLQGPDKFFTSHITPEKFREMLEKYNKDKKAQVIFMTGGEPLMHPNFGELVDICKEYNLATKISTNGILITKKLSEVAKLDYLNVSMDGYDAATFKKYRGGSRGQFGHVLDGLRALKESDIHFSISFVLSKENLYEAPVMVEFAEKVRPSLLIFHNINPHGSNEFTPLTLQDAETRGWLEKMRARTDYEFDVNLPVVFDIESSSFRKVGCLQPWMYFCFNSVGDVSFCCHLTHDRSIGNVFGDYDFNSPKMVEFRTAMMRGKLDNDFMEKNCQYCHRRFMGMEFDRFDVKNGTWSTTMAPMGVVATA